MSIPVDDFTTPGDTVRKPGDFRRRGENGPPIVRSVTKTRKRKGNKPDLLAAAEAEGVQVPDKVTVPQLHELLGPESADDTYGRPSGFGEQIDDIFPIVDWRERQVVLGIAMRPDLLQRLQRLDPNAERDCLQGIAAAAHEAADSSHNADRGTYVHELTAWVDNGRQGPRPVPDPRFGFTDAHLDAIETGWVQLLADNHLTPVAVEQPVVNDDLRLAGTLDRLCTVGTELWFGERCIHQGTVVVVDIKTSKLRDEGGQPQYWESYPIQIEAYRGSVPYDVDTDERGESYPRVDRNLALIAHLDADHLLANGEAVWQLIAVDLDVARQGVAAVLAAKAYHDRDDKFILPGTVTRTPVAAPTSPPTRQVVEQRTTGDAPLASPVGDSSINELTNPDEGPANRREELTARYQALSDDDRRRYVKPDNPDDLDAVEAAIDAVDPFARTTQPAAPTPPPAPASVPALTSCPDEGGDAPPDYIAGLEADYHHLTQAQREWVGDIAKEAQQAGTPFTMSATLSEPRSARRVMLLDGLVYLAANSFDADVVRGLCALILNPDTAWHPRHTTGAVLGSLDAGQANTFLLLIGDLGGGRLAVSFTSDGRTVLTRSQPAD